MHKIHTLHIIDNDDDVVLKTGCNSNLQQYIADISVTVALHGTQNGKILH